MYNLLCMMFYRTANIQKVYGGRTGSSTVKRWSNASVTGTCDGITGMNGWNTSTDCVKMLGIENPYGNISKWVDGVWFGGVNGTTIYIHRFPQQYTDGTSNAKTLQFKCPATTGYVESLKIGNTSDIQSFAYVSDVTNSSSTHSSTYYGDHSSYSSTGTVLSAGGFWNDASRAGLWCLYSNSSASDSRPYFGARLSYRPL